MDAYVYRAALLCGPCAESGEFRCRLLAEGKTPEMDSDHWPHGPYSHGGGEADTPQHCDRCGVFLENPLTDAGLDYVLAAARPFERDDGAYSWAETAAYARAQGSTPKGNGPTVADWIDFYLAEGQ